jgi:hypothetical protein
MARVDLEDEEAILAAAREIRKARREKRRKKRAQKQARLLEEERKNFALQRHIRAEFFEELRSRQNTLGPTQIMLDEEKRVVMARAEVRYLYSHLTMEQVCSEVGVEGKDLRTFILSRKGVLRVRWP